MKSGGVSRGMANEPHRRNTLGPTRLSRPSARAAAAPRMNQPRVLATVLREMNPALVAKGLLIVCVIRREKRGCRPLMVFDATINSSNGREPHFTITINSETTRICNADTSACQPAEAIKDLVHESVRASPATMLRPNTMIANRHSSAIRATCYYVGKPRPRNYLGISVLEY
jgi:hypothetical protein